MKTLILRVGLPVVAWTLILASTSYASPIFVTNFSFETLPVGGLPLDGCGAGCFYSEGPSIPGWTITGTYTGQFQPGPSAGNTAYFNSVPDGITVAYTDGGSISHTVAPLVQLGVTYTLQVDVGVRNDIGDPGTEALVINGNTYLATGTLPSPGGWSTFTATYTGLAADVGQPIAIQLASDSAQADWDNVLLSDSITDVPEPASIVLVGLAALALGAIGRRKRA